MPKSGNFFFSTPQTVLARGRPRKYPRNEGTVRITDLYKTVMRAFRRYLNAKKEFRKTGEEFWQTFKKEKKGCYNLSSMSILFKNSTFVKKFVDWVGVGAAEQKLKGQALLLAEYLAETKKGLIDGR